MKTRSLIVIIVAMCAAMLPMVSIAQAADAKEELKARFKQRLPQITELKDQGKVGETWEGYLDQVKSDAKLDGDARKLMEDENSDRRKLYDLIANDVAKGEKKLSPTQVAERNARRNFVTAKPSEFLKTKDGQWIQRREVTALKREGKVGETWDGNVEAVKGGSSLDAHAAAVIAEENRIRHEIYLKEADKRNTSVDAEAERAGKANLDEAKAGEFIKSKDGKWEKKGKG